MPEDPNEKLHHRTAMDPPKEVAPNGGYEYAELDVTTNFSFLRGASHADELVFTSALLGHRAMAVTDVNTLAGVVRVHEAARKVDGFKLVIGARLVFSDAPDLLVWARNRAAYANLCRILTIGRRRAPKGECHLSLNDFLDHHEELITALAPPAPDENLKPILRSLRNVLGKSLSLAVSCNYAEDNQTRLERFAKLSRSTFVPLVATNHVHYHDPGRRALQDILTCVRHGCTIHDAGYRLFPNAERVLKSPQEMHELFDRYPSAIERGLEIASRCDFSLEELKYEYPDEVVPQGKSMDEHLRELAYAGAAKRYPQGVSPKVVGLLEKELAFIRAERYAAYFLTVHDLVQFARSRGILCQGRGSAANSAVCYCLEVTAVDPEHFQLVFERFAGPQRQEPPDIDIDFEHERREEVIQYVYNKYGRERAAMTGVVISYRGRSAVRDVGKAMGIGADVLDQLAGKLDWWHRGTLSDSQLREAGADPRDATIRRLIALTSELLGFPRHLSQHVGGLVISRGPLCDSVPIENCAMEDRTVIQWDKDDIDIVGMFKVDCLGLGMLTALSRALKFINEGSDEATERRSDEGGTNAQRFTGGLDGQDTREDIPGFDCMAKGDGVVQDGLHFDAAHAGAGVVRINESDAASCGIDPIEHGRGAREAEPYRLSQIPSDVSRLAGGIDNSVPNCMGLAVDALRTTPCQSFGRRGSNPAGSYSQPREEGHPQLTFSSLRRFVASSLCRSPLELHTIPREDPAVYEMISDADTVGVFQIESRAQMSMLPRLRPERFYDLVIEVAIVRPGPIQGDMVHPYLKRREIWRRDKSYQGDYPKPELCDVLKDTLGVPLFQEQAMRIAIVAAGFTPGDADDLRRSMAAWKRGGGLDRHHDKFVGGMIANGYEEAFAENCFKQILGFGSYGFPESHAASFAVLVYASSWIKRYHPAAFCAALLNSQPMGFYQPAQLVRDAKEHGVEIRTVDVNESEWDCTLEKSTPRASISGKAGWGVNGPALRLGFRQVKGMSEVHATRIVEARAQHGQFASVEAFHQLTQLPASVMRRLAEADAFGSMDLTRRQAVWQALELHDERTPLHELRDSNLRSEISDFLFLPKMPLGQEVLTDYATQGLSLKAHPVSLIRDELTRRNIITATELLDVKRSPHGRWVKVAGLVLIRQRPGTASGVVFETIEDETGSANLILWSDIYERYRPAARHATLVQADGYVQREGQVVHVLAKRLFDLSHLIEGYAMRSRDFH